MAAATATSTIRSITGTISRCVIFGSRTARASLWDCSVNSGIGPCRRWWPWGRRPWVMVCAHPRLKALPVLRRVHAHLRRTRPDGRPDKARPTAAPDPGGDVLPVVRIRGGARRLRQRGGRKGFTATSVWVAEHAEIVHVRARLYHLDELTGELRIEEGTIGGHPYNQIRLGLLCRAGVAIQHVVLAALRPTPDRAGEPRKDLAVRRNRDHLVDALNLTGPIIDALEHRDAADRHEHLARKAPGSDPRLNEHHRPGVRPGPVTRRTRAIRRTGARGRPA